MDLVDALHDLMGAGALDEVAEGRQSRVFRWTGGPAAGDLALKAIDAGTVPRAEQEARLAVVEQLAALDPRVCAPRRLDSRLITALDLPRGTVLVTAYEWADGRPLDPGDADDSARLGRTLAGLHTSMRRVDASGLPPVAALRAVPSDLGPDDQLLHGDAGHGNVRVGADGVRLFDLDDCGRGPALFDVANAVYMARFGAWADGAPTAFEEAFLAGYAEAAGAPVDRALLEQMVDVRVAALRVWLDDLAAAPVGIRRADPAWHATLRRFTREHRRR